MRTQKFFLMELIALTWIVNAAISTCLGQTAQASGQPENTSGWGESQLELVLHDRPQLQPIVQKGSALWNWLQAAFANTSEGVQIFWDNRPTHASDPASGESTFPDGKKAAYIRIDGIYKSGPSIGLERSPEEVLSNLVFELNNDKHWVENQGITQLAEAGSISRQDYIRACAKTEFTAAQETADFYRTIWLPFCQSKGLQSTPKLWGMPIEATFDESLSKYPPDFWYPWKYYGDRYDWLAAQREGDVKLAQGDLKGAIADYSTAIKLGPRSYGGRGIAEMAEGDWDSASADLRQCNELSLSDPGSVDYNNLLLWVIAAQKGQKEAADQNLSNYFNSRPSALHDDWTSHIADFLLDRLSEAGFLSAASSPEPKKNQAQQCEAWYYAGTKRLLSGDKSTASKYFRNCLTTNQTTFMEYTLAREELRTLKE